VARLLGLKTSQGVRDLVARGELSYMVEQRGGRTFYRFRPEDVEALVEERRRDRRIEAGLPVRRLWAEGLEEAERG
jgi:hypothetical protein